MRLPANARARPKVTLRHGRRRPRTIPAKAHDFPKTQQSLYCDRHRIQLSQNTDFGDKRRWRGQQGGPAPRGLFISWNGDGPSCISGASMRMSIRFSFVTTDRRGSSLFEDEDRPGMIAVNRTWSSLIAAERVDRHVGH